MMFRRAPHPITKNISKYNKTNNLAKTRPCEHLGFFNIDLLNRLQLWNHWGMLKKDSSIQNLFLDLTTKKGEFAGDITTANA
ncbi:MAG: hypothetical protein OEX09_08210 [Candidatus Bathyarchaeota archaeon]|nr:hypothetical protein [Candidatus Bathyarchaeota archaeon]